VKIGYWRNLRDVDLNVSEDSSLVCLVGENGTGKSAILELLSACAHEFGISQGVETNRGNAFSEPHDDIAVAVRVSTASLPTTVARAEAYGEDWDGRLELRSVHGGARAVLAQGIADAGHATDIGRAAVEELRQRNETQHLFLDSDRAYPPTTFESQQMAEIWQQDYTDPAFTKQWSYRPTRTLYQEWTKYLVSTEERAGSRLISDIRVARANELPDPIFVDPFLKYRDLLREVLPHLQFLGIESSGPRRTVRFDSAGVELSFSQLSGGEREIAFLIGQIDRFRLQHGLMLVDEPELHLNPDLLRIWLAFLRDTVLDGQVWFATHSLEAVEIAGPESTFVFERDQDVRLVSNPRILSGRPILSVLSAAIGSPAFSLSKLLFVLIEGDRHSRERERFYAVCGAPERNRFLESGGCEEVVRRFRVVIELAAETGEQLRLGAVIDHDFRTDDEVSGLSTDGGVHVLGCHEIENVFLDPRCLAVVLDHLGRSETANLVVRDAGDRFAGLWIVERTMARYKGSVAREAKTVLSSLDWETLGPNWLRYQADSVEFLEPDGRSEWSTSLAESFAAFASVRETADLWKHCLGKQALGAVASALGMSAGRVLEQAVVKAWERDVTPPQEVLSLREYLASL
jgi:predicted ATPase